MKVTTVGIDLAKNVIQVHGVDERGKIVLRKQLKRAQVASFFATVSQGFLPMDSDPPPERPRKRFDPLARPFDWYRLPLAIKLAVIRLWRVEQDPARSDREPNEDR